MNKIVLKKSLNPTVTLMEIEAPLVAKKAEPGQFIILRVTVGFNDFFNTILFIANPLFFNLILL